MKEWHLRKLKRGIAKKDFERIKFGKAALIEGWMWTWFKWQNREPRLLSYENVSYFGIPGCVTYASTKLIKVHIFTMTRQHIVWEEYIQLP